MKKNIKFSDFVCSSLTEGHTFKLRYLLEDNEQQQDAEEELTPDADILNAPSLSNDAPSTGNDDASTAQPEESEELKAAEEAAKKAKDDAEAAQQKAEDLKAAAMDAQERTEVDRAADRGNETYNKIKNKVSQSVVPFLEHKKPNISNRFSISLAMNNMLFENEINEVDEDINSQTLDIDNVVDEAINFFTNFDYLANKKDITLSMFKKAIAAIPGLKDLDEIIKTFEDKFNKKIEQDTIYDRDNFRSAAGAKATT